MKPPRTLCVIPARYASTRLPGKPLKNLGGRPLILYTVERAEAAASVDWTVVATDDERVARVVREAGHDAVLTPELPSGTHRAAHVARKIHCRFVLNLQGDEPFMDPNLLNALVARLAEGDAPIATAVHESADPALYRDPNCVKAVLDTAGNALYFSRSPVPFDKSADSHFYRHIGLYGFTREALLAAVELPDGDLERREGLEQLRWLEAGFTIACIRTEWNGVGVDTPDDLRRAESFLKQGAEQGV
ncbi:MAG: 3-deoxy-D-manno-octulosonate cytidylyltransferase [Candidatus Coatesbacteria bacterium RBG_13_66_14]|uniref:3-deoxy-manno-octulosonate cytidylyltransferase n=1 Tax=Candidatus Coatesbacteria bacterium RBG_13_66_14 TaxID=1817816 RepID=A0A1F5FHM4_9BACT|nr:MAG: 3-deoxy-D-manno-octulosonate cytidylyltransferase [Candidatus Coatesbacteria bacterium RBG_13_66_14]